MRPGIAAAVVTHRRPGEFQRLLESLSSSTLPLLGCVVSDHAPTGEIKALAAKGEILTVVLEDPSNPGPGAGWAHAAQRAQALFGDALTAIWYLDDDVVIPPETLEILWREMSLADARAIAPLLEDRDGRLWAFPEPERRALRRVIRQAVTPGDARRLLGDAPIPFCWCTGACFLVTKAALDRTGLPRSDFWMLGEDLEYSMRIAGGNRAVFTCRTAVPHLPPPALDATSARKADYVKFCSLLQNLSYLSFHSRYSRHMRSYLPGNFRRFFCTHGMRHAAVRDAAACFWNGAIAGEPSGRERGRALRQSISQRDEGI